MNEQARASGNTRREFLLGATALAGAAAGCATTGGGAACCGAPMQGYHVAPMERIRVGVVGTGGRGRAAANRILGVPGVDVTAVCDIRTECANATADDVEKATGRRPKVFAGTAEDYLRLCDLDDVDVVYNATSWNAHAPVALGAMRAGKHALVEVPSAMTIDECWELVETSEKTKRYCMQLENCCYGETELLGVNLARLGLLGELVHGEGAYIHDRRFSIYHSSQWNDWRKHWNEIHAGNQYPTHGLGPVAVAMDVNRGDRFDYLVSVDGEQKSYVAYADATLPPGDPRHARYAMADMNVTTIRTAKGRTIMLQHDVSTPRPYSRLDLLSGTKGIIRGYPRLEIFLEGKDSWPLSRHGHHLFSEEETARYRALYRHPLVKTTAALAKSADGAASGHGGIDYVMDLRWAYCLQQGLPLDMDVYDLAAWCAVCELSERSARDRSRPVDFPDFTRGGWKTPSASPLFTADIDLAKIDFANVAAKAKTSA